LIYYKTQKNQKNYLK